MNPKLLILTFAVCMILISIWSYTQVDLNLTILNTPLAIQIQSQLTNLGYFNRPLNTLFFVILLASLLVFYLTLIVYTAKNLITKKLLICFIILTSSIHIFSYTVLSHDIFNYMFDARIITKYGQNPYQHKALDYPQDEWIRFMQWTHRTYPYGPGWLVLTSIPSFLGVQKFLLTYILFKGIFAFSYIIACYFIYRISLLQKTNAALAVTLFAFHPLVILDGLISPRIDMAMIAVALAGIYLILTSEVKFGTTIIILSGLIKFASFLYVPLIGIKNNPDNQHLYYYLIAASLIGSIAQSIYSRTIQPWYFLMPLAFLPFVYKYLGLKKVVICACIFLFPIWVYVAFINTGNWLPVI